MTKVLVDSSMQDASHELHAGPHIPLIQGEKVWGPVSNTTITLFVFLLIITMFSLLSRRALDKGGKLKVAVASFVQYFDRQIREGMGNKKLARRVFPVAVGTFCIILGGNIFGLLIDWFGVSVSPSIFTYMRPMHSDINTTLVLAVVMILMYLAIQVRVSGVFGTMKSYIWNFHGENVLVRCINVFIGWLHLIGLFATTASLSFRLFGNIFAGIVLIAIITFIGSMASQSFFELGRFLSVPFWFFEIFVALIQALVFFGIMLAQFRHASSHH